MILKALSGDDGNIRAHTLCTDEYVIRVGPMCDIPAPLDLHA